MAVKSRRRYDSPRRAEQARQTRAAVTSSAQRLFLRDGFAATTIAAIAAEAGVSAETIYKAFSGKPGLVRAICEQALAGEGPVPAETRSDDLQASEPDPRKIIRGWGRLSAEIAPRVSPILLLLRAAALTDPQMASLREEIEASRLSRMIRNARTLAEGGHLRDGMTTEHAGEIMWTYSSPELYELLVVRPPLATTGVRHLHRRRDDRAPLPPQPPAPQPSQNP